MNKNQEVVISEQFSTEAERRAAAVAIAERIMKVLFFYFEEDQEGLLDSDEEIDNFSNYLWTISGVALSSIGINFVGTDENGRIVATLDPCPSVKEFLIKEDIGQDDHIFYEDLLEDIGPDSGFGLHDNKIVQI